jgi:hypothetical protein
MMRRTVWVLPTAVLAGTFLFPAVAHAKGSTLRFEEHRYAPGERAVGRAEVETWKGSGQPENGPYPVYLVRGRQPLWLGHLPDDAIQVGELDIGRLVANDTYRVRAAFHVPPIPDGRYAVWVCRAECGANKMFGDLVYGRIVVSRATEAALTYPQELAAPPIVHDPTRRAAFPRIIVILAGLATALLTLSFVLRRRRRMTVA